MPEVSDLVEIEVAAPGDRLADAGTRDLLAEDRVDQGGLADSGLAEDRQVEPPNGCVLLLVLGPERISEPVCAARHRASVRGQSPPTEARLYVGLFAGVSIDG